jgi:CBS domain-containing protein
LRATGSLVEHSRRGEGRPLEEREGEPVAFLARHQPFRDLGRDELEPLITDMRVASFEPGATILRQSGEPAHHLYVIRSGIVDLLDEGAVVDHLDEGELFGISVLSGLGPALSVRARTATECYLIDADRARELLGSAIGLAYLTAAAAHWRERDTAGLHARHADPGADLTEAIRQAADVPALTEVSQRFAPTVGELLDAGVDPVDAGHVIGLAIDELTRRLIELHTAEAGEPPTPFSWIALGSAARHEQSLNTDQDHALAFDAEEGAEEAVDPYFAGLAETVTAGLEACGIARCDGGVMAVNPAWRRTVPGWRRRFGEYMADTSVMGSRITGIAFDFRRVTGELEVDRDLDEAIRGAHRDTAFMRRLAKTVLELEPAAGRRGEIALERRGEHAGTFDVKHGAITPITNLARFYAIDAGLTENRTVERLRGAADAGRIPAGLRDDLWEAFRLAWRVRLEHHVLMVGSGAQPDDFVDPATLRPIPRRSLGEALRVVAEAQSALARELRLR